jgi:hypothetical protein
MQVRHEPFRHDLGSRIFAKPAASSSESVSGDSNERPSGSTRTSGWRSEEDMNFCGIRGHLSLPESKEAMRCLLFVASRPAIPNIEQSDHTQCAMVVLKHLPDLPITSICRENLPAATNRLK